MSVRGDLRDVGERTGLATVSRCLGLALMVAVLAALLAACGGSDDGSKDDASAGGTTAKSQPTGTPIKVMTESPVNTTLPPYPNLLEAAKIYGKYVNDKGGINGHPLEVITCDDRGDANEAAKCARQAVKERVVAVVGSFSWDASQAIPILEDARVAWFGACCAVVPQESTSPVSFVTGTLFSFQTALARRMIEDGCEAPATVQLDIAVKDLFFAQMRNGFRAAGFDPSKASYTPLPARPQDYSAQVAQATDGSDCILGNMSEANWPAFLSAFRSAGGTQRLYGAQGNLNSRIVEQFPAETEGAVIANSYPNIEAPVWADYRDALERYDAPDLDWSSLAGLGVWASYTGFTEIASQLDTVTAETFLEAASRTTRLDTGGMMPVLDLTKPYTGSGGDFPRILNRNVTFDTVEGGKVVPGDGTFIDETAAMDGKAG